MPFKDDLRHSQI